MSAPTSLSNSNEEYIDGFLPVVGESTTKIVEMLRVFVGQDEPLLVSGPSGSGKFQLARWCHQQSSRRQQQLETLELLSVPEELHLARLVGWKPGACTQATSPPGALARAASGTLFVDDIDKLSPWPGNSRRSEPAVLLD